VSNIFVELTVVLIIAGVLATLLRFLRQPAIIAYLLTGLIAGPLGYYSLQHNEAWQGLAEIGITLLLFLVGLELDISNLQKIGRNALLAAMGQVVGTAVLAFVFLKLWGFNNTTSGILSAALTFSSTVIVVKLLNEKKDLHSLYGKIAVAMLLLQDFVAILLLIFFSGAGNSFFGSLPPWQNLFLTLVKGAVLIWLIHWHSVFLVPKVLKLVGKSEELLMVLSLAWAFGLAALVSLPFIGFNVEIGGFLAGLALAKSAVHFEISSKIKSLRDFFIIIFFITLGSSLIFNDPRAAIIPALVLSAFVLIAKPLVSLITMSALGFKPRTSFFTSVSIGQISEFSLILAALGLKSGYLDHDTASLLTLTAIITMAISSYFIVETDFLYARLKNILTWFDWRRGSAERGLEEMSLKNHIIIAGAHRLGHHVVEAAVKLKLPFIIIDHDPEVIERYRSQGLNAVCGDITDSHIQQIAAMGKASLIISTVPDPNDNSALLETLKKEKVKAKIIMTAMDEDDALALYDKKIDYALLPHFVGGQHIADILKHQRIGANLEKLKKQHLRTLRSSY
jgi:Kef-type K+ transport system membrane component KefB